MPLPSRSLQLIGAATPNRTFKASMFSSSFRATGRNHWRRGFCERAPAQGYEGSSEVDGVVSGDSHVGDVRAANYGHRQGYAHQQYRPWRPSPPPFRTGPPPRSADHRNWIFASSQPTPDRERFKVLSYNILADYLALDHQSILYTHIPNHILAWEWRKRRLFIEFGLWSPDIMCLQEVDQFCDLEGELAIRGYSGVWKMRTGNAVDGCAIFWRTNRFQLRHEESIEFSKLGLRDNVAQICVLESKMRFPENAGFHSSFNPSSGANQVVVCNTHVLYNPKRGEIKLGQVRILLDRAFAISRAWNDAPVIVCGDFNSIPMSPLYKFIATQKLNFSGLARNQISGQYSATLPSRPNSRYTSYRPQTFNRYASESRFGVQGGYSEMGPDNQHNMENSPPIEKSAVTLCQDVEQKAHRQMPSGASSIKLGESEIFSHHGGEQSSYLEFANKPSRTSEFCSQQSIIHANIDTDKNREEAHQNILDEPCSEGHKVSSGSADLVGEIKPTSTSSMNNSIAYFHSYQTESNIVGNAPFCHTNKDDLSTMDSSKADDTLSEEKPCTSCAINLSRGEILEEIPVLNPNLSRGADSTQNSQYSELSGLDEHEDRRSSEVFGLQENGDPNFFVELLGVEDDNQSVKDVNSPNLDFQEKYSSPLASVALNVGRHFYDPYCWSPMEMEVASGDAKCTVVEHPLKLRSVYTDVEDYTGTKDSSREPQVTSYNQQFMGTVDYIWCSEDLQTVKVLDTIPKHVLQRTRGFPTQKWGSDHIALACELAFSKGSQNK